MITLPLKRLSPLPHRVKHRTLNELPQFAIASVDKLEPQRANERMLHEDPIAIAARTEQEAPMRICVPRAETEDPSIMLSSRLHAPPSCMCRNTEKLEPQRPAARSEKVEPR
jgi:hypothetical protein